MSEMAARRPRQTRRRARVTTLQRHAAARDAEDSILRRAGVISEIAYAAKIVAREIRVAALTGRLGMTGSANASGNAAHVATYERFATGVTA
jgi:fructose-1,6-bisphosphatase